MEYCFITLSPEGHCVHPKHVLQAYAAGCKQVRQDPAEYIKTVGKHLNFSTLGQRWPIRGKRRSTIARWPLLIRQLCTTEARASRCAAARNSRVSRQPQISSGVSTRYFTRVPRAANMQQGLYPFEVLPNSLAGHLSLDIVSVRCTTKDKDHLAPDRIWRCCVAIGRSSWAAAAERIVS